MAVSAAQRKAHATVHRKGPDGEVKDMFPVFNHETAEAAMHLIGKAKPPLTASERASVLRAVRKYIPDAGKAS